MALDAKKARELLRYDPLTGEFRWNPRSGRQGSWCNLDRPAGHISKQSGYLTIRIDKKLHQAHRLAWLLHYGEWPPQHIDHINGLRLDNRIGNLRSVPNAINRQNMRSPRADSQTRVQGVTLDKRRGTFFARIRLNGRSIHLGSFAHADEAHVAYINAKRQLHAGCTI